MKVLIKKIINSLGYELVGKNTSKPKKSKSIAKGLPKTYRKNLEDFEADGGDKEWQQIMMYCLVTEKTADIPGDIAEFGVASGASFKAFVRINNILNKSRYHKVSIKSVYGFDSFEGLPKLNKMIDLAQTNGIERGEMREGGFNSSETLENLEKFCSKNQNCQLVKGWFSEKNLDPYDVIFTGRIASSMHIMQACLKHKKHVIYFDKGYIRSGWKSKLKQYYLRFSINSFQPLHYFQNIKRQDDRWKKLNTQFINRKKKGSCILFAGCSPKFARWHGFEPHSYATSIVSLIKKYTDKPVIYRSKPSDRSAKPIPGTIFSDPKKLIQKELKNVSALVTYSSNAAVDAILAGIPSFVLGPSIARPVSSTDLEQIESCLPPNENLKHQWACDLSYCQWTPEEIKSGESWSTLKELLANESSEWDRRLDELTESALIPNIDQHPS